MDQIIVIEGDPSLLLTMDGNIGLTIPFDGDADIGIIGTTETHETYIGPYEVTPRLYAQSLETEDKLMSDDVTVYEIPITRTSNPEGGQTVLIG